MSQQCSFKNNSPCGSSQYYASSEEVIHILKCEKPVSQHLRGLSCDTDLQIPEGLLILYRYGNYSLDSSTLEKYICPKHRDNLGIYWRRQQRRCQSTFHPTNSHAKVERGIQVQVAKEIWMESGVYIPVGAGICNACRRRHLPRSEEGKKIIQRDIDQFMRFSACSKTYSLQEDSFSQTSNGQEINSQNICSIDTEESQSQSDKFSSIAGNTQNSSQDWYELQKTPREKLNAAMKILSESFEPINSQLTKKWEETSKSARSYYTKKARECIELVLSIMAPCQEDILLEKIQINSTQEIKLDNMTASVMEAFQNTSDSRTQTQILSIIVNNHTKTELQTLIPGLTINKIDSARKHALVSGPGTILNQPKIYRMKLSKPKVSHFVEFILNPIYSNIVGFGETILKMSSKEKIKVPKVIRNVIDARLIETYLSYCKDSGFDTFSRASLYRILNVCHASKQKSLQGLDNITALGMGAIDTLLKLLTKLETFGVTYPESKKLTNILHMVNTFMKFEYKTHLHKLDGCEDHCTVFALSDPGDAKFATACEHSHETSCQKCSLVESCVPQIRVKLNDISTNIPDQIVEELTFELDNSEKSLIDWKKHILRTIHQDQARTNVLKNLHADQGLVILDWAMKFLPYQFRETQSDFFGKKGISWHISCLVTKSENEEFDLQCYVHILENGSQGWFSVANIILHLLTNIKSTRPTLKEVFLKSDNAACYHCTNLLAFIQQNNGQFPIKVAEYNFSEAQSGKDLCDSKTGSCRMHIYKYANEGHDVLNPRSMKLALDSYGGVKGTQSCIVTVNADDEPKTKIRMPGISTYNNFNFENDGIIARKAYKVGEGHVIKTSTQYSETISVERVYKLEVLDPFAQDQPISGKLKKFADNRIEDTHDHDDPQPSLDMLEEDQPISENSMNISTCSTSSAYFSCPDFSCDKVFATSSNLDRHLLLGNHNYRKNTISSMDTAVQIYSSSCIDLQKYHENVIQEASHEVEVSVNLTDKSRRGWGLKSKRANARFSDKVKTYLQEICASCEKTGSRPDFIALSEELRKATDENGNKLFTKQEWLNPPQIKGFIANIISKSKSSLAVKKPRTELQEINVDDDEKLSEVISMLEMNDYNENAVGIVNEVFSAVNI